jgi:hypothetical protein
MFVLDKPQDAFFRLLDGREERILAGPGARLDQAVRYSNTNRLNS